MKKILFFILLPILGFGQTKIGADIDGEAANDMSGRSVSLSSDGTTLAIGSPNNNENGTEAGSVRVYKNVSGIWTQIGTDIDGEAAFDYSGNIVSLSGDGNTLAIGAPYNDGSGLDAGSVRVYQNISGTWTQIGADIDGEADGDISSTGVSLSTDGTTLAIGAAYNSGSGSIAGSVRVYKNVSGIWTKIGDDIDGEAAFDSNGNSVSLSGDGNTLAIGAYRNDGNGTDAGSVRVYKNISGSWIQIGADIDGETDNDYSGDSISLSTDGTTLAIGATSNEGSGNYTGSVRVYKNVSDTWTQIGADIDGEGAGDWSGRSVSLSSDGTILVIGAPYNTNKGSVRVYKNISGTWTKIGADIDGEADEDQSGWSVSLSNDGTTLAIGASYNDENGTNAGSVRVYDLSTVLSSDSFVLSNFSAYPNPASEFVTINLQEDLTLEKVNIYNTLGQLVKTENKNSINVNSLTKGTYFFEIITDKGKAAKTIVVQ